MIRPLAQNSDGSIVIAFDELGHTGTILPGAITFARNTDGTFDPHVIVLTCPDGCGSQSYHPITGDGTIRPAVQEMFVRQTRLKGCPCGVAMIGRPMAVVIAHMRSHTQEIRGDWTVASVTP